MTTEIIFIETKIILTILIKLIFKGVLLIRIYQLFDYVVNVNYQKTFITPISFLHIQEFIGWMIKFKDFIDC